jgi:hypothetical protein
VKFGDVADPGVVSVVFFQSFQVPYHKKEVYCHPRCNIISFFDRKNGPLFPDASKLLRGKTTARTKQERSASTPATCQHLRHKKSSPGWPGCHAVRLFSARQGPNKRGQRQPRRRVNICGTRRVAQDGRGGAMRLGCFQHDKDQTREVSVNPGDVSTFAEQEE